MFLYDVIFAINVRWIFTRFSTHQTREINSTLRCILDSNAIKKHTHTYVHRQSASFIHHRAMYFFPSTTTLIRLSKTVIHETVPTVTDTDISLSHLLNHGTTMEVPNFTRSQKYEQLGTLFLFFFIFKTERKQVFPPTPIIVIPILILIQITNPNLK